MAAICLRYHTAGTDDLPILAIRPHVHLPHRLREHLVHVHPVLGARLHEGAAPDLGKGHALHGRHLALGLQVHLVADQQDWHAVRALDAHYLVAHGLNVLEGLVVGQGVDHNEPLHTHNTCKICRLKKKTFQSVYLRG